MSSDVVYIKLAMPTVTVKKKHPIARLSARKKQGEYQQVIVEPAKRLAALLNSLDRKATSRSRSA